MGKFGTRDVVFTERIQSVCSIYNHYTYDVLSDASGQLVIMRCATSFGNNAIALLGLNASETAMAGSYRGGDDDDEISVSLVEETGVSGYYFQLCPDRSDINGY